MYCPECGTPVKENHKFCPTCGSPIQKSDYRPTEIPETDEYPESIECHDIEESKDTIEYQATIPEDIDIFIAYVDNYIRKRTTFTSVTSMLEGYNPLRYKWTVVGFVCLLGYAIGSLGGLLLGLIFLIIAYQALLPLVTMKRVLRKYTTYGHSIDIDHLAVFLEQHLCYYPFTAWQRGYPKTLMGTAQGVYVVVCIFQNKTYHRIMLDDDHPGIYRIETTRTTQKERLKYGGGRNPGLLYKADCLSRPILEAAMKYYLRCVVNN